MPLGPGSIAFTGFNADGNDNLAFVALTAISAGEVIYFSDNEWNAAGTGFTDLNENVFSWTAGSNIAAGTIVTLDNIGVTSPAPSSNLGTYAAVPGGGTNRGMSASGETIYAYVASPGTPLVPTAFLAAISTSGYATTASGFLTGTGLVEGTTALNLLPLSASNPDIAVFAGLRNNQADFASYGAILNTAANWIQQDGSGDQSIDGTAPDVPFSTQAFTLAGGESSVSINDVAIAEGNTGTTVLTFTVTRSDNTGDFSVDFATSDGTASSASDYTATSGTLNFTAGGALTQTVSVTLNGDTAVEANETLVVTLSNIVNGTGIAVISDGTGQGTISNDDVGITAIHDIQGAAHTSPLVGQVVTTTGIVTAVDSNGFYLQAADADADASVATSEAIFVFTSSAPTVAVGDAVNVAGTVTEFFPGGAATGNLSTTELTSPVVTLLSSGNALPTAIVLGNGGRVLPTANIEDDGLTSFDATTDGIDFYESLEAMRVTIPTPRAVSATNSFGEIFTVADGGANATGLSARGTIVTQGSVGDGLNVTNTGPGSDFNPERIQIDADATVTPGGTPQVNVGAVLADVTGVLSYNFGNFEVVPTSALSVQTPSTLTAEVTALDGAGAQLTIGSYNLLNLDPNDADGDADVGAGRFDAIASQIVNNLQAPDIVALQEVQDNSGSVDDGTVSASLTLQTLVNAIAAAGGPTYTYVDNTFITNNTNGGQPGGNIRVAYLYDASRVTLQGVSTTPNASTDFAGSRPPLVAHFEFNGETVTVIDNHFSSKGGSTPLYGTTQPSVNGAASARLAQATNVADYVTSLGSAAKVVVLGDLNEFTNEESLAPLSAAGLNAMSLTLAPSERYSFVFDGNAQELDQVYVSGNLTPVAALDIVHTNAEFAETPASASDHDPSVLRLDFTPAAQTLGFAAGSLSLSQNEGNAGSKTYTFVVERSGGTTGALDFSGTIAADSVDAADFGGVLPLTFSGTIASGATSTTVTVDIAGDTIVESDESFSLTLTTASNSGGAPVTIDGGATTAVATIVNDDIGLAVNGINVYGAAASLAGQATTPVATNDLVLVRLGSIQGSPAGAESVSFEAGKAYSTNINANTVDVTSVTAQGTLQGEAPIALSALPQYRPGGVNSVAVKNGIIAVGYENVTVGQPGFVALFDASTNTLIKTIAVGVLPDQLTFSPDGQKLLVANEAEAVSAANNPVGSISIISLAGGAASASVTNTIGFDALNGFEATLQARGLALLSGQSAAADIEPEYITVSADGSRAYVTLQEVNAVAVIDLTNPAADRPLAIQPLGAIDRNLPGNAIDTSDQDGAINLRNVNIFSLPQPDAIASYSVGGSTYFVTANEGDARVTFTDSVRFNSAAYVLDPSAFPNAAALKANANLGRLNVLTNVGDTDNDGDFDKIYTLGGRGISIYRQEADGSITKVRETGGEFEAITAAFAPGSFNSNQSTAPSSFDTRSDDKGPEPEGVTIGTLNGRVYAFVGLERVGGQMVYDITDPANASFVTYVPQTAQDLGPETATFVAAADSPTGQALLIAAQEVSNTVTLYSIQTQSEGDDTIRGGNGAESWSARGGNDSIQGNGGNDAIDGGTGTDTAVHAGSWLGYSVTAGGSVVTDIDLGNGNDGTDTLTNVELLSFNGISVAAAAAVNDAPIGMDDNNGGDALAEDGDASAAGNVLTNDTDADLALGLGEVLTLTSARSGTESAGGAFTTVTGATLIDGTYGQLTIDANGAYSYMLDNTRPATQALLAGQVVTEQFTYTVIDAHGLSDTAQLDLDIAGAYDAGDPLTGTAGNDTLTGTSVGETLFGLAGSDTINANGGDDVLVGGAGADTLNGGEGVDTASYAGAASAVSASLGTRTGTFGEALGDRFVSIEKLVGSDFDDVLMGNTSANTLDGGKGNDTLAGNGGADVLIGNDGNDTFVFKGTQGYASIAGGDGVDTIVAGAANTRITIGAITGVEAFDGDGFSGVTLAGTNASETIDLSGYALRGIAAINANNGNDNVTGSAAADVINGGSGNDTLIGGAGADVLSGGAGTDVLTGGQDADTFLFIPGTRTSLSDTINDFDIAQGDVIDLSALDAITTNGTGNDAFHFIGGLGFSHTAGELRFGTTAGSVLVQGDVNGDAVADFTITLVGVASVSASAFIV